MNNTFTKFLIFLIGFNIICICFQTVVKSNYAAAQTLPQVPDLSKIDPDKMTDADVANLQNQLQASGTTIDEAGQQALAKGMPQDQLNKLKTRVSQPSTSQNSKQQSNQNSTTINNTPRKAAQDTYTSSKKTVVSLAIPVPKVFGADLFTSQSSTFEPNLRIATPVNYILGPDDDLLINVSGFQETTIKTTVQPEGNIFIPQVGSINVNGLTIESATTRIRERMAQTAYSSLKNGSSKLNISLGNIKSIHVTIIGGSKPGNYTVSSLTTVFNSLFLCGGPGDINTYRNIELIRGGKIYQKVDLYQFLTKGDAQGNVLLKEGDVVNIPVYKTRVTINGQVKRPGIFELKDGETFNNLLFFAGSYTDSAYRASVKVKQITDVERRVRDISKAQMATYIPSNGDVFQVDAVLQRYENAVTIVGAVYRPGEFELTPGFTVGGLIKRAGGLMENVFTSRALIKRSYENGTKESIAFNVTDILNGSVADIPLIKRDSVIIAAATQFKSNYNVQILGEVRKPDTYIYRDNMSLKDIIFLADGFTDAASSYHLEVSRRLVAERANKSADTIARVYDIDISKALDVENNKFILQPYDVVTVRRNPGYIEQQRVTIVGEVNYPGSYTLQSKKDRVSDLLQRAGGLTTMAYVKGIFLIRANVVDTTGGAQVKTVASIQRSIKDTSTKVLEDTKRINVRIAIDLPSVLSRPGSSQDYLLEKGDSVEVLKADPLVKVSGEVLSATKTGFLENKSLQYYLSQAGGTTDFARRRKIYVIYANGHLARTNNGFFGLFRSYPKVETGSEIVVPRKAEHKALSAAEAVGLTSAFISVISLIIVTISSLKK